MTDRFQLRVLNCIKLFNKSKRELKFSEVMLRIFLYVKYVVVSTMNIFYAPKLQNQGLFVRIERVILIIMTFIKCTLDTFLSNPCLSF